MVCHRIVPFLHVKVIHIVYMYNMCIYQDTFQDNVKSTISLYQCNRSIYAHAKVGFCFNIPLDMLFLFGVHCG